MFPCPYDLAINDVAQGAARAVQLPGYCVQLGLDSDHLPYVSEGDIEDIYLLNLSNGQTRKITDGAPFTFIEQLRIEAQYVIWRETISDPEAQEPAQDQRYANRRAEQIPRPA